LASAGSSIIKRTSRIDDLIVDEAAAATEPELYIPLHLQPKRLLAVGDPLQLPATVLSRRAITLGYAKSLHERLMYDCKYDHIMLNVQYRMNPEISSFPSYSFYKNMIQNGENVVHSDYGKVAVLLLKQEPYTFLQVEGVEEQVAGGSYCNHKEAIAIADLIKDLELAATNIYGRTWCRSDRIRVITFYQAQVSLIQAYLEKKQLGSSVVVATVDSSQGCEADIVLISFVRSQPNPFSSLSQSPAGATPGAGFLNDDRRMNVALTRAKYQLICVGNVLQFPQMPNAETLHLLARDAEERGVILSESAVLLYRQSSKKQF
jgi:superfamily I DNA and/or RNA helicase